MKATEGSFLIPTDSELFTCNSRNPVGFLGTSAMSLAFLQGIEAVRVSFTSSIDKLSAGSAGSVKGVFGLGLFAWSRVTFHIACICQNNKLCLQDEGCRSRGIQAKTLQIISVASMIFDFCVKCCVN